MNDNHSLVPVGASPFSANLAVDDSEADAFNDETFGACNLDAVQIKSDFGDNGEFLGENLPDFFDAADGDLSLTDPSQQPSIDALLAEDASHRSSTSYKLRQSGINPLFNMAINQAQHESIFLPPQIHPQFEQRERMAYNGALLGKMQYDAFAARHTSGLSNFNLGSYQASSHHVELDHRQERHDTPPMAIGELMQRARLEAMNADNSGSPSRDNEMTEMSPQLMDAIQRSEQISTVEQRTSPSAHAQPRRNRPAKSYPRPPLLHTWHSRDSHYDAFAGLMSDREKQWIVKIQLHQVSQTPEEDYYFHKWSQQKRHDKPGKRNEQRAQQISYPILQLLESIQQEKELAQRLSQSFSTGNFSNVNPTQPIPYASPTQPHFGKQSIATPRHPRCTLDLGGRFSLGKQTDAITHDKYHLGLLLHIENLYQDILHLDDTTPSKPAPSLDSIVDRYIHDRKYPFVDTFGRFRKSQLILLRLYSHLSADSVETILIRLYGSLCYMVRRWPADFHIELPVMNTISLMQQQVNAKKTPMDQFVAQTYAYYTEMIKPKMLALDVAAPSTPFSDPILFTNAYTVTILIDLLLTLERQCYLSAETNSMALPKQTSQKLQRQLQYHLTEQVLFVVGDLCQALLACSSPTYTLQKMLKPFAQAQQQQFGLLCKFLRAQTTEDVYAKLEPRLIACCVREARST